MANDLHAALHLAPQHAKSLTDSPSPVSDESYHGHDDHTATTQANGVHDFDDVLGFSQGTQASSFDVSALDHGDGLGDLDGFDNPLDASEDASSGPKRRSRRAPNTAERRATHNAVERARRETLNGRFMDLAAALPSMSHVKRPSKSMIVNRCKFNFFFVYLGGSTSPLAVSYLNQEHCRADCSLCLSFFTPTALDFVDASLQREASLMEENNSLRKQVNQLRTQLGLPHIDETPSTSTLAAGACDAARKAKKQRTLSGSSAGVHDAALAAVAARRSSMSSEQNNNTNSSSSFSQSLSGIGESPSVKTSSVGTPNDDLPSNSPQVALASTPATGPVSHSHSLDTSAASPQPDLSKLAGPSINGGDLWGMRAQLQAAAQAAIANANAFNQQQQQQQHQNAAHTPSVPSFDFLTQQQQPQQNGSAPGPHMDIGSYLMALHLQQQQHQHQQMHHTTPSPFGMIGGLGFGASAPPMSSAGQLASYVSQAPALSP